MAERIKKGFFKVLPLSVVMLMIISISLGVWYSLPVNPAKAAAINAATKVDVTPGTQFTTSKGIPVYRLVITNSGDAADTLTTLAPTPSGTVVDTKATLHFFRDLNTNGIADQGDTDLGASAAFAVDNTKQTFNITDVAVAAGASVQILITVDMLAEVNANTFTLGFALAADIAMTVAPTGTFPLNNANALTISNVAPAVTVANGAAKPAAKTVKASATNVAVHQLLFTAGAGTSDSIVSLAPTPAGTANDNLDITSVVFYIDSGTTLGAVDGTDVQLVVTPTVYSADNTKTTFTFSNPVQIAAAGTVNILVVYNMGTLVGQDTKTFTADIAIAGDAVAGSGTAVTESSTISNTLTIDITAPTITSAQTFDNNSNGRIDRITVVYAEAVNDADYNAFAATGYSIVVGTSTGTGTATLIYQLTELGSYDTGATPALTWTAINAQDLAGNNLNLTGAPAAATDKALPIALSAAYLDTDTDGRVDRVDVTFSETMALSEYDAADWTFPTAGSVIALAAESAAAASTTTIRLTALGAVDKTGGGTTPTVSYDSTLGIANSLKDAATAPNNAASFVALNIDDGAKPAFISALTGDANADGTVDRLVLTFSESSDVIDGVAGDGFPAITLVASSGTATIGNADYAAAATTTLTLNITTSVTANTALTVTPTYAVAGAGQIDDVAAANNEMADAETVAGADGAKPAFLIASTGDANSDGTVDQLVMTFSESVTVTDGGADTDITLAASSGTATVTAGVYGTVGTTLTYTISVSATGNTAITVTPTYATAGAGDITDAAANEMANGETVTGADGAKPAFLSALTSDANSDGTVDRLVLTFSESSDVTDGNAGDGFPAITLVASSGTATIDNANYAGTASAILNLNITVSATSNTAITVTPTYTVAAAGQIDDVAAANNEMANAETVAGADGAAPIVTAVALSLTSSNVITFTYSEVMTVTNGASTATKGDTTVAGTVAGFGSFATAGNVTVATVKNTVGGNGTTVLTVTLANEAASYLAGTSTTEPSGVFTPVGSAEVKDAVNLQVNTVNTPTTTGGGSWDLAKPTITSVTVSDAASNDGKIDRAVLVLNSAMRDANVTGNGTLGGLAGTFTTGAPNDATTTFNITDPSTQPVNTALGAHTSFLYSGATTLITDLVGNLLDTTVDGQIAAADIVETDGAQPIVTAVALSLTSNRDVITFTYSEAMTVTNGASATGRGDITGAGVVGGFGTFATTGNVTVPTTKNTVGGSGTTALTVTLANEATGYMNNTSTTEPSGVFTPATSVQVVDAASNQVNNLNAPTATGGGTWDLTKPTITSATVSDASGSNGKVDRAVLVLNSAMRDANVTDSNGALGGLAGTFTTGTANDATTTFNLTSDAAQPVNTALGAHTQFNYTGATTFLIDLAGNLLDTVSDGAIADGDIVETDGAVPILVSATYRDLDSNGAVDTLRTTWSENVTMTGSTAVDWTIVGGSITAAFSAAANDAVAGTTLDVTVTADANETSSGVAPTIAYDNDDVNNSVVDGATNAAGTNAAATATDAAAPAVATAIFYDASPATNDGKLDRISVVWSENISAVADGSADWAISSAANFAALTETAVICNSGAAAVNECRYTFTTTTVKTNVGDLSLAYTAGTSVTDGTNTAASKTLTSASSPAFIDGANPVVASTSPADGASGVALDASFAITFSEAMTTTDITTTTLGRSPTFTLGSAVWSSGDTVVTYASHDAWAGLQIYTIDLVQGSINSAALLDSTLDNSAIVADPYTFTTVAASGGGGGGGGGLPASMTVTAPNGGETLTGGGTYNLTWSATGVVDTVNLYYSLDSGINFPNTIATAQTNDGSYTWTVPNISSSTVKVKAVAGSLNDISDSNFTITYTTPTVSVANSTIVASPTSVVANGTSFSIITVTAKDAASVPLSGKVVTLTSSRGSSDTITTVTGTTGADGKATFNVYSSTAGTSTYTATAAGTVLTSTVSVVFTAVGAPTTPGAGETPTALSVGDLIKSPLSTSVYYYGSDNKRHVFPNEKTYKSWYVDFSGIKSVTASQLQGIALGANVKVRPGTVLVKIDTNPKVYAVEPGGLLRWVPTEARALTLYGSAWASRIIDVPLIFWVDYSFGSDITTDAHPTGALIQYTGTTDKYYIQGAERRLISTAGFTANKFQLSNVLAAPTTISYTLGTPITAEDTALTRIY